MKLAGASWSYCESGFGPDRWQKRYTGTKGQLQSPINIESENVVKDGNLGALVFSYGPTSNCTLTNDGRTLQITMSNSGNKNILHGGPLMHGYQLAMIRFHWSADDTTGSEHQVDGESYPLEIQFLHWNKDLYKNIGQALTGEQGICIVAVLFQVGDEEHEALTDIIRLLSREDHKGCFSSEMKSPINPADFIPGSGKYWTYQGSLTTPPLTENVTWIVYQTPEALSQTQMDVFRRIRTTSGDLMVCNSRPLCPSNNRVVRESDNINSQVNSELISNHDNADDVINNNEESDVINNNEESDVIDNHVSDANNDDDGDVIDNHDGDVIGNHDDGDVISNHDDGVVISNHDDSDVIDRHDDSEMTTNHQENGENK